MNYIFIHIPKTGGTSVAQALGKDRGYFGHNSIRQLIGNDKIVSPGLHNALVDLAMKRDVSLEKQVMDTFSFSVVRNPWDRLVSWFFCIQTTANPEYCNHYGQNFKEWVMNGMQIHEEQVQLFGSGRVSNALSQSEWLVDFSGKIVVDTIIRFEELETEWKSIMKKLNAEDLPHVNKSILRNINYREHYDNEMLDYIDSTNIFQEDIKNFNFVF
jgi:hypothetical protein